MTENRSRQELEAQIQKVIKADTDDFMELAQILALNPCEDLAGANLEGANLEEANLEGANLEGANLEEANLEGANLEEANLEGANLEGANLEEANLEGANLRGANFKDANLKGTNLKKSSKIVFLIGPNTPVPLPIIQNPIVQTLVQQK